MVQSSGPAVRGPALTKPPSSPSEQEDIMSKLGYFPFRCPACGAKSSVALKSLCSIWEKKYAKLSDESKSTKDISFSAEIECFCGHKSCYDSPMSKHVFSIAFNELVGELPGD